VGWWSSDGFDAKESIGDNVVLFRDVVYISGKLDNELKVIELPR
jgi:hypothetical protein